ncbi:MAG: aldolase [Pseudomonadota bacterium]|jgi:2-dehydro-3-deoxyphosphogluconate aldolase/(4S)-4-hydroxy-2-oxoglutarate aldolase
MQNMPIMIANRIVPVVVINDISAAIPLAETLLKAGINNMEITLRTPNALAIISKLAQEVPELIVGAGTILNRDNFISAFEAGAKYIISPGLTSELINVGQQYADKIKFIPGICTPSQAMDALNAGFNQVKFFPAEPYNAYAVIKSLAGVFPQLQFCPTGGLSIDNVERYLSLANIFAVGLSSIVEAKLIEQHNFAEIYQRCCQVINLVKSKETL